jgi:hypothetical protein
MFRAAPPDFGPEMMPFVHQLSVSLGDALPNSAGSLDSGLVETITTPCGVFVYLLQIGCNAGDGGWLLPESRELWMMKIAFRPAEQNRLRKQPLPPECQQTLSVQIAGM